ncbi:DKNYY domain-containing protein [Myxococcus sp. K15C18031901]|uniref:DKNYY domain-containing protein n=1 Tax=Myxococcus dinghuensis TaxID=2906761 RepID=UPI0020A7B64F|nr:DKNYY domain-containing protein [Myxococcus dinghuensis]MCP3100218.1 DKNYY domain-containing protein [Myxococcus dinghuensis]
MDDEMQRTSMSRYTERDGAVVCTLSGFGAEVVVETTLDSKTWSELGDGYAKDATRVLYDGEDIDADAASFVVLRHGYAKDAATVFSRGTPEETDAWDAPSFVAFGRRYVADRRGVFCIRYTYDCYEAVEVSGADPRDFEEIGLALGRAPRAGVVYNNGVVEARLEASSIELRGRCFVVDRNGVYHLHSGGKHTDTNTLSRIDADPRSFTVLGEYYAADAGNVFYFLDDDGDADVATLRRIVGVSPVGFEVIGALDGYARAGQLILNHGVVETEIVDPASFEALAPGWARDRLHVYEMRPQLRAMAGFQYEVLSARIVPGADPTTFRNV